MSDTSSNADVNRPLPTAKSAVNAKQNPDEWVTGDAPMTAAQATLLKSLCSEMGEPFDAGLSKADATKRIEALQRRAAAGKPSCILEEDQTDG